MSAVTSPMRRAVIAAVFCCLRALSCPAQRVRSGREAAARLDAYLNTLTKEGRLSGSVLVARGGRVLISRGYGSADLENGVPNGPQTKFRIGSVTKQFTAAAVMMLHERGRLRVEDGICNYLADCPEAWRRPSIRHLLTHTSGLWNLINSPGFTAAMHKRAR